jgi:hypothetical protein
MPDDLFGTEPAPTPTAPSQDVIVVALVWLPTTPPRPAPAIMTEDEVCVMLSITGRCLRAYHDGGRLRGFRCGRTLRWKLTDILAFADAQKELKP